MDLITLLWVLTVHHNTLCPKTVSHKCLPAGIKNTTLENWIELDNTYLTKHHLKKKLFTQNRTEVLAHLPGIDEGLFEGLDLLKETLVRRYPSMFRLQNGEKDIIENLVTGDIWDLNPEASTWEKYHPFEVMSLLATEDFFILYADEKTGETSLRGAGVCFPAGWKIETRIGKTLFGIHAGRVPTYETRLAKSMDRFFQRLTPGPLICRYNHAIDDSDELFHRHSHHNLKLDEAKKPELKDLHLRVERQVLQRLPRSKALLFTIRTYVTPITEVTRDREVAEALRSSVRSYSEDVARYKNRGLWEGTLMGHLEEVLGEE
ncbi:heme-dependent oxidative N-demethylase family protein [Aspergillus stella-maris]|uniref:heme-dependent oxidative N-demethylase family protein n=1 Tax=Aspergillus stella-maris TaxID=1810926 RepID=UPI003CCCF34F